MNAIRDAVVACCRAADRLPAGRLRDDCCVAAARVLFAAEQDSRAGATGTSASLLAALQTAEEAVEAYRQTMYADHPYSPPGRLPASHRVEAITNQELPR